LKLIFWVFLCLSVHPSISLTVLWNYINMLILAVYYHACCLHVVSSLLDSYFSVDLFLVGILSHEITPDSHPRKDNIKISLSFFSTALKQTCLRCVGDWYPSSTCSHCY
jgi:hypothetical protein